MRHVIVHYHIFKNAGSTFASTLRRNFGPLYAEFEGTHFNSQLNSVDLIEFLKRHASILAVTSHHLRPPKPEASQILSVHDVLFLRQPIDRIRSMYDFYRNALPNGDQLTVKAKELDLRSFLSFLIDASPEIISNPQVNLIANGGARIPDDDDLVRAVNIVRNATVLGITEQFNVCCTTAEYHLRSFFPNLDLSYVPENVTPGRRKNLQARQAEIEKRSGPQLYNALLERNKLDIRLLEIASAEVRLRFESLPFPAACLEKFNVRVQQRASDKLRSMPGCEHPGSFLNYINAQDG